MALDLNERKIPVDLLIKERVAREILELISPKPFIRIKAWARPLYLILAFLSILLKRRWKEVLIVTTDHKMYARYRWFESLLEHQTVLLRFENGRYAILKEGKAHELQDCLSL